MRDCWGMGQDVARMLLTSDIMCNDSTAECLLCQNVILSPDQHV